MKIIKSNFKKSTLNRFYTEIEEGSGEEKITIPRSLFVEAKGPDHLLGLMCLANNIINSGPWNYHVVTLAKNLNDPIKGRKFGFDYPNPKTKN